MPLKTLAARDPEQDACIVRIILDDEQRRVARGDLVAGRPPPPPRSWPPPAPELAGAPARACNADLGKPCWAGPVLRERQGTSVNVPARAGFAGQTDLAARAALASSRLYREAQAGAAVTCGSCRHRPAGTASKISLCFSDAMPMPVSETPRTRSRRPPWTAPRCDPRSSPS